MPVSLSMTTLVPQLSAEGAADRRPAPLPLLGLEVTQAPTHEFLMAVMAEGERVDGTGKDRKGIASIAMKKVMISWYIKGRYCVLVCMRE